MSSQMVTVKRTDPDGTVHTYAWPKSLAEADPSLTIVKDDPKTEDGYRKPIVEPAAKPGKPVTEPAKPAGKTEVKES